MSSSTTECIDVRMRLSASRICLIAFRAMAGSSSKMSGPYVQYCFGLAEYLGHREFPRRYRGTRGQQRARGFRWGSFEHKLLTTENGGNDAPSNIVLDDRAGCFG
jgi:hypothetical protein